MPRDQSRSRKKGRRRQKQSSPKKGGSPKVDTPVLPDEDMDARAAGRQSGADGTQTPSPGRGVHGEGGGAAPSSSDQVGARPISPPGPPRDIPRPYRLLGVTDTTIALQFSEWCQGQGGKTLGIHTHPGGYIGIADEDVGWQVHPAPDLVGQVSGDALKGLLTREDSPKLLCQDTATVIPEVAAFLELPLRPLLELVQGDIRSLKQVLNRQTAQLPHWTSPADAAYDAVAQEKQWAKGAPQFYGSVAVVRACQHALALHEEPKGVPFRIVFNDLLPRVIAHFSQDPTLIQAFRDGKDILTVISDQLPAGTESELAIIFWAAMGCDTPAWNEVMGHAGFDVGLPDPLDALIPIVQKAFPTLHLSYINQREDYGRERVLNTLYGNPVRWGLTPGEAIARRIIWSVGELPSVAAAAFWGDKEIQLRSVDSQLNPFMRQHTIRGYVDGEEQEWRAILTNVSDAVGTHLIVGANPQVIWGS